MPDGTPKDTERFINPEQKADSILRGVESVELDLFQEYAYRSQRKGDTFTTKKLSYSDMKEGNPYDILLDADLSMSDGSPRYVTSLRSLFGYTDRIDFSTKLRDQLFCAIGEKNGKIVLHAGGQFQGDKDKRLSVRSFTFVFNNTTSTDAFVAWLREDPNQALKFTTLRGMPEYDVEKRIIGSVVKSSNDIFKNPINKLHFADLRSGEKTIKEFTQKSQ